MSCSSPWGGETRAGFLPQAARTSRAAARATISFLVTAADAPVGLVIERSGSRSQEPLPRGGGRLADPFGRGAADALPPGEVGRPSCGDKGCRSGVDAGVAG